MADTGKQITVKAMNLPKFRPTLTLDEDDLPEIKNLKVGDKCHIEITAELQSQRKGEDYDDSQGRKVIIGTFRVLESKYMPMSEATKEDKMQRMKAKVS